MRSHPSRLFLEHEILPWIGKQYARVLFVGTAPYTYQFERFFKRSREHYTTIDPVGGTAVWGGRNHIAAPIQEIGLHRPRGYFDCIVFNGVFGFGIDELEAQRAAIKVLHDALAPDGLLLVGWNTNLLVANGTLAVAWNTYLLTYTPGANGTITGVNPQSVNFGANGTAVTAVPATNYYFAGWSDGSTNNPRTDTAVTNNLSVTANFAAVNLAQPAILPGLNSANGWISFQFSGLTGLHYRVEYTPVLPAPGAWQVLTDITSLAASPFSVSQPLTNGRGFYRVGFVP